MKKLSFCPEPVSTDGEKQVEVDEEKMELSKLFGEIRTISSQGMEIENDLLMKIMKQVLSTKLCKVHGFILDGFPETMEQAQQLFQGSIFLFLSSSTFAFCLQIEIFRDAHHNFLSSKKLFLIISRIS